MRIHYDMDVLPEDRSLLPKYNSDVCKWHLFFSNLTEDVFHVVKDIFALDYGRKLKFQLLNEEEEESAQTTASITIPDRDELIRGFLQYLGFVCFKYLYSILLSVFLKGAYHKLAVRAKGTTVRQVLTGTVFLNFHHLHPEFQKFILRRIEKVYNSKKEVQSDVTFFLIVSVSASILSFPFPYLISVS